MPSTYEHIVTEYGDFGDLSEDVFFPGQFDMAKFGNQTIPSVIWSNTGECSIYIALSIIYCVPVLLKSSPQMFKLICCPP